ncbi:MAG: LTA synthase family protein [Flavobacteriales bacterium]|nr:LTA synthase family protein [Flavobacteriales bacterium]
MRAGPLTVLLLRLGLVLAIHGLLRLLFVWHNAAMFPAVPMAAHIGGLRFDLFALAWMNLPWVVLVLLFPRPGRVLERAGLVLFLVINGLGILANTVDVGYYAFTLRRSTSDLLTIATGGGDLMDLAPTFLVGYWYLVLAFLAAISLMVWGYRAIGRLDQGHPIPLGWRLGWRSTALVLLVIASRGGLQLMPLQPMDATRHAGPSLAPVVLSTPYTMLMSFGKPSLAERHYMPQEEADRLWPVVHHHRAGHQHAPGMPDRPNVVIIILESFSAVYSGTLSGDQSWMPFLDSLMGAGINFTRAYANGRRSIDGIPAILASMPELMDEAFLSSRYAATPFTSLAHLLDARGYGTSFYHGGRNGTMGLDGFTRSAGFQRYVGMNEYPGGAKDFDGQWGIRDRPFLRFWAEELAREPQPFLSTVFTLSSHHPYRLPKAETERFARGTQDIHPTLLYADDALRGFFRTAQDMPWYGNTLFVITADHTADLERTGKHGDLPIDYWVPLLFVAPWITPAAVEHATQHIDILPTVMAMIGHPDPFFSFGHDALASTTPACAVWVNNGIYTIIDAQMRLRFDGTQVVGSHPAGSGSGPSAGQEEHAARLEQRLKAAIQQFNHHLLNGTLVAKPVPE